MSVRAWFKDFRLKWSAAPVPAIAGGYLESRRARRHAVQLPGVLQIENRLYECMIEDIATLGARVAAAARPFIGVRVTLQQAAIGVATGVVIRHTADGFAVMFDEANASFEFSLALPPMVQ